MNQVMKEIQTVKWRSIWLLMFACVLLTASCKKEILDKRASEGGNVVGGNVNGDLFLPEYDDQTVVVTLPEGRDLSRVKLQLLVANGELIGFENNREYDCRKPLNIQLKGADGSQREITLRVQSPPALASFIIEGLAVEADRIHFSRESLIVQVPEGTDLSNLAVTMQFVNGT